MAYFNALSIYGDIVFIIIIEKASSFRKHKDVRGTSNQSKETLQEANVERPRARQAPWYEQRADRRLDGIQTKKKIQTRFLF